MMKKRFCEIIFFFLSIFYIYSQTQTASSFDGFVYVQGGSFFMGSENGDEDEKPAHKVTIGSFYICNHEVTQSEWLCVMENNPSYYKGEKRPVEQVSWFDAIEYCNLLSKKEGLEPCYEKEGKNYICNFAKNGYRLPTEAEWEYAASGGLKRRDNKYSGGNFLDDFAWYENNCNNSQNVMTLRPNELGLYDMSGNVWEWCWDKYGKYSKSAQINPLGVSSGSERVMRGGRWRSHDSDCRVTNRSSYSPKDAYYGIGFRVVRTAEEIQNVLAESQTTDNTEKNETVFNNVPVQTPEPDTEFAGEKAVENVLAVSPATDNTNKNEGVALNNEAVVDKSSSETVKDNSETRCIIAGLRGGVMVSQNYEHIITPDFGIEYDFTVFWKRFGLYGGFFLPVNFSIHIPVKVYGDITENKFNPNKNLDDSYEYYFEPDGMIVMPFYFEALSIGVYLKILKYTWFSFGGAMIVAINDMHGKFYYRPKGSSDDYSLYGEGYALECFKTEDNSDLIVDNLWQLHLGLNFIYKHIYCGALYKYNFGIGHQFDMCLGYIFGNKDLNKITL